MATLLTDTEREMLALELPAVSLYSRMVDNHLAAIYLTLILGVACIIASMAYFRLCLTAAGSAEYDSLEKPASGHTGQNRLSALGQQVMTMTLLMLMLAFSLSAGYLFAMYRSESAYQEEVAARFFSLIDDLQADNQPNSPLPRVYRNRREVDACTDAYAISLGKYSSKYAGKMLTKTRVLDWQPEQMPEVVETPLLPYIYHVLKTIRAPELRTALRKLYCGTPVLSKLEGHLK